MPKEYVKAGPVPLDTCKFLKPHQSSLFILLPTATAYESGQCYVFVAVVGRNVARKPRNVGLAGT